ncbi:unnamed protein product [Oncorhynchus mykiss]|uniref:EF-hand domain-containing protein n=1 Tax=Oncorhynchus mykiss TaxID=8022 RepID=A0A060W1L2_ONCMY|nr:unnamed protein product [Oncorhynchus mykiss]
MDEEEQNRYVAQLKEEFDSCDTTGTGYLDKEDLSSLCHKLSLDAHLPLLLDTLLGPHHYARVNFEEFKEGFVAVLSRSLDFSTSEEESSYLEPVVPEEVKPKFVKGTKRYGRRSRPDRPDSELPAELEDSPPFRTEQKELSPSGVRRAKLRRSTSLESVESLKSDEETGSHKDTIHQTFEAQGQQKRWKRDSSRSPLQSPGPGAEVSDSQMRAVWEELGVGGGGFLNRQELSLVCDHLGLQDLNSEELDALFRKLDTDLDGKVSLRKFQKGLFREKGVPVPTSSTPIRPNPHHSLQQAFEERMGRSTSPSLLSATVGQRLLTRLDDGSGCTSPERVITLWNEEGIRNSRDILQTLDFPLEERVSLAELTLALDNELLVSGNGIHQAALISYKNEIQFLQVLADQACQERDKVKADLEWADRRNLQLVREVDDRHATIESLNETKIKGLEQEFRYRLTALRSESEQESEVLLQQVERERAKLEEEVEVLHAQDASLQEEICNATQENHRLEEEGSVLKGKLSDAENTISKLQRDLDQLLLDKFGSLDPNNTGLLNQEERVSEIIKEYELQCRELRDRNDELNSEVEMLKSQGMGRRPRRARDTSTHAWSSRRSLTTESDSDDPEMKIGVSPIASKKLQVANKNGLGCLESLPGPVVSIETEMAMEQFKERHSQEVQDLKIELETKVNFYERSLELMRRNMEVERKDISSGFKVEISELEEQKAQAEEQVKRLREAVEKLQTERAQREQAELEQNYAREISNLVQRLTSEKDQLEAELKLKMDQELLLEELGLVRDREREILSEVSQLREELHSLRAKLMEELRKHRTTVDCLQSDLDCVTEELNQWKRAEKSLQEALRLEQTQVMEIKSTLDLEREEMGCLGQENAHYIRLADQLSNQIVEMEMESSKLQDHIHQLNAQLVEMSNLVSDLRTQLEAKFTEVDHLESDIKQTAGLVEIAEALELCSLRGKAGSSTTVQLQQALLSSQAEVHRLEEDFEWEKGRMKEQLVEMEKLVMALEMVMDPTSPHSSQLDEVNCENSALKDRLAMLQQDVQRMEEEIVKKKKKLDEVEQEHEKNREKQERLHKENAKYQEEVLDLRAHNLQLSGVNAELSSRLRADQGAVQMLTERLAQVSREQEEGAATARQLQETSTQQERERLHLQAAWRHDKELLERELHTIKEKLQCLSEVESSLTSLTLKHQWLEQDKERLLREVEERTQKVEKLQESLLSVDSQVELLRSQLQAVDQEKNGQTQEVANHQRMIQDAQDKVKELEASMGRLSREKEQLRLAQKQHEEEATMALQKECQSLRLQNQELLHRVYQLQGQDVEVQSLTEECLTLKNKQTQLETARAEAQDQALMVDTALTLAQAQHVQELQQLREHAGLGSREQLAHFQAQLADEKRRGKKLQQTLRTQAQQASTQIGLQQEQYEKVIGNMQEGMEGVETKLRSVRKMLQEKVNQLKEQLAKNAKSDIMLKDLYVENSQLMKALQVTEQRQKSAEKKNFVLEEKITALNKLLRKITPASLSA